MRSYLLQFSVEKCISGVQLISLESTLSVCETKMNKVYIRNEKKVCMNKVKELRTLSKFINSSYFLSQYKIVSFYVIPIDLFPIICLKVRYSSTVWISACNQLFLSLNIKQHIFNFVSNVIIGITYLCTLFLKRM